MSLRSYLRFGRSLLLRDRPVYVHYAVTSRCNLRCRSCVIWRRDEPELDTEQIFEMAAMFARLGCVQVSLGGGEPALRKDLADIVQAFQSRHIRTRVLTNGVALTPDLSEHLVAAGMREVSFSLDSLDEGVQDSLDNTGRTYRARMENLLALARILPRRGSLPVLNTVVTPRNLGELLDIVDFAEELGFFVSLIPIHLADSDADEHRFYSGDEGLRFTRADERRVRRVYQDILDRKRRGARIVNSTAFLERSPEYLLNGSASWPCRAGEQFLSVSPDGRISPCHAFEGQWGIDHREFEARFATREYRDEVRQRAAGCEGCFRPCWAEIGLLMGRPDSLAEMARSQLLARRRRPAVNARAIEHHLDLGAEP
jgi:MoaA/NifB/PqqE/SkfB family radical SAM enzyme